MINDPSASHIHTNCESTLCCYQCQQAESTSSIFVLIDSFTHRKDNSMFRNVWMRVVRAVRVLSTTIPISVLRVHCILTLTMTYIEASLASPAPWSTGLSRVNINERPSYSTFIQSFEGENAHKLRVPEATS